MNKITVGLMILMLLLAGCGQNSSKKEQPQAKTETKTVQKDESALRFKMVKFENLTVEEAAKAFKNYLEEDGMHYPRFIDFKRTANLDNNKFDMRPSILVIIGHPKKLGQLINENPEVAYDLPFHILFYQDADGNYWMLYRDFDSLKEQYILTDPGKILDEQKKLIQGFIKRLQELQIKRRHE